MYKYTVKPELIEHFRKHHDDKKSYSKHYNWYLYLKSENLIRVHAVTQEEHRIAPYIETMIGWYLFQNMVYYSKFKRDYIPIHGYLVEVEPLFKVQKV